ncbi:MAG: site-specific integrase, partial [Xanthobacteraceae bacterium]
MARAKAGTARHSDEALVALYLDMLAAERGAGANTLAAYRHDLEDFSAYLKDNSRSIAKATTDDLRDYLSDLTHRGMQVATVARRLSAMRQVYRFFYAEGHRADDPAAVLQGPKRARSLPKTLTLAEVDHLLHTAATCDPAAPLP